MRFKPLTGNEYHGKGVPKKKTNREIISVLVEREVILKSLISSMDCTLEGAEKDIKKAKKKVTEAQIVLGDLIMKINKAPEKKAEYEKSLKQVQTKKKKMTNPDYKKLRKLQEKILQLQRELRKDR